MHAPPRPRLLVLLLPLLAWLGSLVAESALGCGSTVATSPSGSGGASASAATGSTGGSSSKSSASSTSSSSSTGSLDGGAVGAPCTDTGSCAAPETCVTQVPGGYCTVVIAECSGNPFAPGLCPSGAWCVNGVVFGGNAGDFCMEICAGAAGCRQTEGYRCCPWGDAGVCYYGPGCP